MGVFNWFQVFSSRLILRFHCDFKQNCLKVLNLYGCFFSTKSILSGLLHLKALSCGLKAICLLFIDKVYMFICFMDFYLDVKQSTCCLAYCN